MWTERAPSYALCYTVRNKCQVSPTLVTFNVSGRSVYIRRTKTWYHDNMVTLNRREQDECPPLLPGKSALIKAIGQGASVTGLF